MSPMKSCLFALTISLFAIGCTNDAESTDGKVPQAPAMQSSVIDTPPPHPEVDPDYHEDSHPQTEIPDSLAKRGYTREQGDSIKRAMTVPPKETPGKGYDGRLPKDSTERARMLRIRELQRVRDSLWREQEYGKKGN